MPRMYKRKTERRLVTQKQIDEARELIKNGSSQRKAAKALGLSESTLRKRLLLGNVGTSLGRFKMTFTEDQENELVGHCKVLDSLFYGMTSACLRRLVFAFAEANQISNRFDKKLKMAGRDWVEGFLSRHSELCIRKPQPTSLARAIGLNKMQVQRFYKNLKQLYEKYKFEASHIYNMDGTGISTVPEKIPKDTSFRGKKVVDKIESAEMGETVTIVCCMSATGYFVPPVFIYQGKKIEDELLEGGPNGCKGFASDSGKMNAEIFMTWLNHFIDHVNPQNESPVLLIMSNYSSHISLEVTLMCRKNNIHVVTLPPGNSHKVQPLDRGFFGPLKSNYSKECDTWMNLQSGKMFCVSQVATLFNNAYQKVATVGNASFGFAVCGIYPFNDTLFDDYDFAPALMTEKNHAEYEMAIENVGKEAGTVHEGAASLSNILSSAPRDTTADFIQQTTVKEENGRI